MERDFHRWLQTRIKSDPRVKLGIGDDAAILAADGTAGIVVSTDSIAEGTHFDLAVHSLHRVGRKNLAVNLSDLAAMGATPVAALLSFQLPRRFSLDDVKQIFLGGQEIASQFDVMIVGGDTNSWDGPLVLGATVIGREYSTDGQFKSWPMSGAKVGDQILVSGAFGGSILGHHLDFEPRVVLARHLIKNFDVNAVTDCSDSLSLDLAAIATTSQLGIEIEETRVPISEAAKQLANKDGRSPLQHALTDGEDFELIMAVSPGEAERILNDPDLPAQVTRVGHFIDTDGFWMLNSQGARNKFEPTGYQH